MCTFAYKILGWKLTAYLFLIQKIHVILETKNPLWKSDFGTFWQAVSHYIHKVKWFPLSMPKILLFRTKTEKWVFAKVQTKVLNPERRRVQKYEGAIWRKVPPGCPVNVWPRISIFLLDFSFYDPIFAAYVFLWPKTNRRWPFQGPAPVGRYGDGGDLSPLTFSRYINPIQTGGGLILPTTYRLSPLKLKMSRRPFQGQFVILGANTPCSIVPVCSTTA